MWARDEAGKEPSTGTRQQGRMCHRELQDQVRVGECGPWPWHVSEAFAQAVVHHHDHCQYTRNKERMAQNPNGKRKRDPSHTWWWPTDAADQHDEPGNARIRECHASFNTKML